ncbi:unnamed protein product, partial [Prorocentrum cordatum]
MGPAGAVCLALGDPYWVASFAFAWRTDEGDVLDLRFAAPSTVQQLARQSAVRAMWRRWPTTPDSAPELGPVCWQPQGCWLEQLAAMLHKPTARWRLSESGAGAVRSLVAGATRSQARLHMCGYAADGLRRRCWSAPGTCESCQPERESALDGALLDGLPRIMQNDPRWARLLVPLPSLPSLPPRDDSGCWHALLAAPGFIVTGLVYVLLVAIPPFRIHADHLEVILGLARGRAWAPCPGRSNADLWVQLWAKLNDHGGLSSDVRIVHVRLRQHGNDQHRHGNDWADVLARLGSGLHCFTDQRKVESKLLLRRLRQTVCWVAAVHDGL